MMPGIDHCFGGAGPDWVNYLNEIDKYLYRRLPAYVDAVQIE